jgi:hypothetical protein
LCWKKLDSNLRLKLDQDAQQQQTSDIDKDKLEGFLWKHPETKVHYAIEQVKISPTSSIFLQYRLEQSNGHRVLFPLSFIIPFWDQTQKSVVQLLENFVTTSLPVPFHEKQEEMIGRQVFSGIAKQMNFPMAGITSGVAWYLKMISYQNDGLQFHWNSNSAQWIKWASKIKELRKFYGIPNVDIQQAVFGNEFWNPKSEVSSPIPFSPGIFLGWHGTKAENISSILETGLDPDQKVRNGSLQGKGCYITGSLKFALQYSPLSPKINFCNKNKKKEALKQEKEKEEEDYFRYVCLIAFMPGNSVMYTEKRKQKKQKRPRKPKKTEIHTTWLGEATCIKQKELCQVVAVLEVPNLCSL